MKTKTTPLRYEQTKVTAEHAREDNMLHRGKQLILYSIFKIR